MSKIPALMFFLFSQLLFASSQTDVSLQSVPVNVQQNEKLQRGAQMYMNYCSGCHSLKYMRYNRMAKGLGLTTFDGEVDKDLLYNNLIFTEAKVHDPIKIAMPKADAEEWFGIVPPDLTLIARQKGADWIYTYLKSFYVDETKPFGANNLLVPGVAMPNVLAPLQGKVIAIREGGLAENGDISHLLLIKNGSMNQHEFNQALEDLVNFLVYVGEPAKLIRYEMGIWVLVFLFIFLIIAYQLKKAYWRKLRYSV